MWYFAGRHPCWVHRDRLAARASPLPQVRAHRLIACLTSSRSGYGRETCPSVEHWSHTWSSDTYLLVPRSCTQEPCSSCPGPLAQPYRRLSPALSKLSTKTLSAVQQNRSSHASLPLHPLQQHLLRDPDPRRLPPALPTFTRSKNTTHSRCSEEVCSPCDCALSSNSPAC